MSDLGDRVGADIGDSHREGRGPGGTAHRQILVLAMRPEPTHNAPIRGRAWLPRPGSLGPDCAGPAGSAPAADLRWFTRSTAAGRMGVTHRRVWREVTAEPQPNTPQSPHTPTIVQPATGGATAR